MKICKIADLFVGIDCKYPTVSSRAEKYETNNYPRILDFAVRASNDMVKTFRKDFPDASDDECEYLVTCSAFYSTLLDFDGIMIHASAVLYDGYAYLFSADSGVGKSTHAALWVKKFGHKAEILNDDKPALRVIDGDVFAYGTPWSGKTDTSVNKSAKVKGICFLERSRKNSIERENPENVLFDFLKQTLRPSNPEKMDKVLSLCDTVLRLVPVYRMRCNMDIDAADVSYKGMNIITDEVL